MLLPRNNKLRSNFPKMRQQRWPTEMDDIPPNVRWCTHIAGMHESWCAFRLGLTGCHDSMEVLIGNAILLWYNVEWAQRHKHWHTCLFSPKGSLDRIVSLLSRSGSTVTTIGSHALVGVESLMQIQKILYYFRVLVTIIRGNLWNYSYTNCIRYFYIDK